MYFGGGYFRYSDVYDAVADLSKLVAAIRDLDPIEAAALLCQMNLDLRLVEREKEPVGKVQQEIAGGLLDDETIARFKQSFGNSHMGERPIFHTPQLLNVLRLVIQRSIGLQKPFADPAARYKVGTACLMMNDLSLTQEETADISTGSADDRRRSLMTQMLCPFEIVNTAAMAHVIYRARIMFHILLHSQTVVERIKRTCGGFDFEQEFLRIVGLPLPRWQALLFGFYCYFLQYLAPDGTRQPDYIVIDRYKFKGDCTFTQPELDAALKTLSLPFSEFKNLLDESRPTDWRFDFSPFKSKPFIELVPDKFYCHDVGFLVEKMHSGVFWTINDGLDQAERPKLFKAWGILFEEYINWFLSGRTFNQPLLFFPSPQWADNSDESFDGIFMQDSRCIPMEYKGGFLKLEARYSGNKAAFEADLELKIGAGCRQLASKIEALFHIDPSRRRRVKNIPLDHVTRVVPLLVVQDLILRGPFINWWLNRRFNELLRRDQLRPDVTVEPLNVAGVQEIESMAESAEGGTFDLLHGLQLRCFRDPEMLSELHNFLMQMPSYGKGGKSNRIETIVEDQWKEMNDYLFGQSCSPENLRDSDAILQKSGSS